MADTGIRRILIATDMSEMAAGALRYGNAFREQLGASGLVMFASDGADTTDAKLRDYLGSHVDQPDAFNIRVVEGPADAAIISTADEIDADLIIMGTHGRTGWRRAVLGSVAEAVLHGTDRPVLTVGNAAAGLDPKIRSILCPVNFTPIAHAALKKACALAQAFGAELTVMNVAESAEDVTPHICTDYERWVDDALRDQCQWAQVFVSGDPAAVIAKAADDLKSSLIVIGSRHKMFRDETVGGTTAEHIVRSAHQPVLTIMWKSVWDVENVA
jgi:nucleotide-binding universal stress UspA family protein